MEANPQDFDICFWHLERLRQQCRTVWTGSAPHQTPTTQYDRRRFGKSSGALRTRLSPGWDQIFRADYGYFDTVKRQWDICDTLTEIRMLSRLKDEHLAVHSLVSLASQKIARDIHLDLTEEDLGSIAITVEDQGSSDAGPVKEQKAIASFHSAYVNAGVAMPHLAKRVAYFHAVEMILDVIPLDARLVVWLATLDTRARVSLEKETGPTMWFAEMAGPRQSSYLLSRWFESLISELVDSNFNNLFDSSIVNCLIQLSRSLSDKTAPPYLYDNVIETHLNAVVTCIQSPEEWLQYAGTGSFRFVSKALDVDALWTYIQVLNSNASLLDITRYANFMVTMTQLLYDLLRYHFKNVDPSSGDFLTPKQDIAPLCMVAIVLSILALRITETSKLSTDHSNTVRQSCSTTSSAATNTAFGNAVLAFSLYCRNQVVLHYLPIPELVPLVGLLSKSYEVETVKFVQPGEALRQFQYTFRFNQPSGTIREGPVRGPHCLVDPDKEEPGALGWEPVQTSPTGVVLSKSHLSLLDTTVPSSFRKVVERASV